MLETQQDIKKFFKHDLKLRHLRIIAMLAQLGQVSHVAKAMNVTQPAISKVTALFSPLSAKGWQPMRLKSYN